MTGSLTLSDPDPLFATIPNIMAGRALPRSLADSCRSPRFRTLRVFHSDSELDSRWLLPTKEDLSSDAIGSDSPSIAIDCSSGIRVSLCLLECVESIDSYPSGTVSQNLGRWLLFSTA